jgi:hypothetical protein
MVMGSGERRLPAAVQTSGHRLDSFGRRGTVVVVEAHNNVT